MQGNLSNLSQTAVQKAFQEVNKCYEEYQTRTHDGELKFFPKLSEAFEYALANKAVWKISWTQVNGERARFVRHGDKDTWSNDPIDVAHLVDGISGSPTTSKTD